MSIAGWTLVFVVGSFALYSTIAIVSRVQTTSGFYVAGRGVSAVANGMATGADWMSAASFISMAGLISFMGYDGAIYLMGWTGGYVLLALLVAPYLRRYGRYTIPEFVGDRFASHAARLTAVVCAVFISFTYVAGQMRGVGVVFSRFLTIPVEYGVVIGGVIVLLYATLGGMRGITYTQVAQYCVLIVAFLIPAGAISWMMTGNPIPQIGFGSPLIEGERAGVFLLRAIDQIHTDLGLPEYTGAFLAGKKTLPDVFAITLALMTGTAGLPHVLIRFYTVKSARLARWSVMWALLFIAILYTTAPAVAAFARVNMIQTLHNTPVVEAPEWFRNWEATGLIRFTDLNGRRPHPVRRRSRRRAVHRPGHHGPRQPGDRRTAGVGGGAGGCGRPGGGAFHRGGAAAGHFGLRLPRPAEELPAARDERAEGTHRRAAVGRRSVCGGPSSWVFIRPITSLPSWRSPSAWPPPASSPRWYWGSLRHG